MKVRMVNTALLVFVLISLLTGVYIIFVNRQLWLMTIHRVSSIGTMVLLPWKAGISWRSLKRGWQWDKFDRSWGLVISLVLALLAVGSTLFAFMWAWRIGPFVLWLYQTVLAWHWILALVLLVPLLVHVVRKWPKPRSEEFTSRRGLLRGGAVLTASVAGWAAAETLAQRRATPDEPRRITGSRGRGEFTGNDFPRTGEWINPLDVEAWRLSVTGAIITPVHVTYTDLLHYERATHIATLDCTLGWYTTQRWEGIWLSALLEEAQVQTQAIGFLLRATSGYAMPYALAEAEKILLCTHIDGEVLSHEHGYPLRAVVPHRRGWFWVKWLREVQIVTVLPDITTTAAKKPPLLGS